jgi:putative glycosyltransferase (TIGR04348 family)
VRIALVTPAGRGTVNGNRHTALRWAAFLRGAGHRVWVMQSWSEDAPGADLLLALHARRSHPSIAAFAERRPGAPIVLALTGTDVYRDIQSSLEAQRSLELATRLIVLQPKALEELAAPMRRKAHVVIQSASTRLVHRPVSRRFRFCVIGNLRSEKDPLRAMYALRRLEQPNIEVVQLGAALEKGLAAEARAGMRKDARYRWLGSLPHWKALRWLASSHAMVISSLMEGGANVVCEALRIGVPVLATRISGNVGLLGPDYPAYFRVQDDADLARLVARAAMEPPFYERLRKTVRRHRGLVRPGNEQNALLLALSGNRTKAGQRVETD